MVILWEIKGYETSVKFASSFIVILFGSACLGYYLGSEIFGWKSEFCLALSGIMIFCSIVVETLLFIIKEEKTEMNKRKQKSKN